MSEDPEKIEQLLEDWKRGSIQARDELFEVLLPQLKEIARASLNRHRPGVSMETGDLLHNAFLKISGGEGFTFNDKCHLMSLSAVAMKQVLMDHLRSKQRHKRNAVTISVRDDLDLPAPQEFRLTELGEALRKLEQVNAERASMVQMRYFAGMTSDEIANVLGCSKARIKREWEPTIGWLREQIIDTAG